MRALIDVECVADVIARGRPIDLPAEATAGVKPPGNYRSADAIAKWWRTIGDAKREEQRRRWLLHRTIAPDTSHIVAIGLAVADAPCTGPADVWSAVGDEMSVIDGANEWLQRHNVVALSAWNGGSFDFPYLRGRLVRLQRLQQPLGMLVRPEIRGARAYWSSVRCDDPSERCIARAMDRRSGWGLQRVAQSYGLAVNAGTGGDIADAWAADDLVAIDEHVREDVWLMRAIMDLEALHLAAHWHGEGK